MAETESLVMLTTIKKTKEVRIVPPTGKKSAIEEHFSFASDDEGKHLDDKHVVCLHCKKEVGFSQNTTNLRQHLNYYHAGLLPEGSGSGSQAKQVAKQSTLESFSKPRAKRSQSSKRYREITQGSAAFLARDLRPVATVEGKGFAELLETLEPAYSIPSRKHVMTVLEEMFVEVKARVRQALSTAEYISLTTDFWTSHAVQSYLGVTAHFITPEWGLSCKVLQTREVSESHTSAQISDELKDIV